MGVQHSKHRDTQMRLAWGARPHRVKGVPLEEKGSVLPPMEGKQRGRWLDRPGDSWAMKGERKDESDPAVQLGRAALCSCSGPDSPHTFAVGHVEKLDRPCAVQRGQMSVRVCLEPTLGAFHLLRVASPPDMKHGVPVRQVSLEGLWTEPWVKVE